MAPKQYEPMKRMTGFHDKHISDSDTEPAIADADFQHGANGPADGIVVDPALRAALHREMAEQRARFCDAQQQLAERELNHNMQQMATGLDALEAKLAALPRVGPIPVSAHPHQGGTTPQYTDTSDDEESSDGDSSDDDFGRGGRRPKRPRGKAERIADAVMQSPVPRLNGALPQKQLLRLKRQKEGQARFAVTSIPAVTSHVPPYKAWAFLLNNERAVQTGRQMFYIDASGETVPASDSDQEQGDYRLDGTLREQEEFMLKEIAVKFGITPEVVAVVAQHMEASPGIIEQRMHAQLGDEPEPMSPQAAARRAAEAALCLDPGAAALVRRWCRKCRRYNCLTHPDVPMPRPHARPLPMPVHATDKPCGADCYKLQPGAVAAPLGHPQMAAAPLERMDSMPKRRGKGRWRPAKRACLPNGATAGIGGTSADEAATSSGDDEDSDNPNGAAPTAAAKTTHAAAAAGAAAAAQPARSRLGQNGSSGAAAKERMAECDLRRQGDAANGTVSGRPAGANGGAKAAPEPSLQPADSDIIIVLSDTESDDSANPPPLPDGPPNRRPSSNGDATSPESASGSAAQNGDGGSVRAVDSGSAGVAQSSGRAVAGTDAADPLLKVFRQVGLVDGADGTAAQSSQAAASSVLEGAALEPGSSGNFGPSTHGLKEAVAHASPAVSQRKYQNGELGQVAQLGDSVGLPASLDDDGLWKGWSELEKRAVRKGVSMFGWDSCRIARLLFDRPCSAIREQLQVLGAVPMSGEGAAAANAAIERADLERKKGVPTHRRKNAAWVKRQRLTHQAELPWPGWKPCACVGRCAQDCPCLRAKTWCEKFCACGPACALRFPGCNCKGRQRCSTKTCPCAAASRECDPDLCKVCASTCHGEAHGTGMECYNMRLRLHQHKRIAMGLSYVAGWGAFLREDARKHELIGEYTGELVDQEEAERRGKVYDRDNSSYLFNLNSDWVLDARQRGNKLRFANHSTVPNCRAEILMVDGDHRVGIFAARDMPAGSELFYDYKYDDASAPDWARRHAADYMP